MHASRKFKYHGSMQKEEKVKKGNLLTTLRVLNEKTRNYTITFAATLGENVFEFCF